MTGEVLVEKWVHMQKQTAATRLLVLAATTDNLKVRTAVGAVSCAFMWLPSTWSADDDGNQ
jgi:hypothetical protein